MYYFLCIGRHYIHRTANWKYTLSALRKKKIISKACYELTQVDQGRSDSTSLHFFSFWQFELMQFLSRSEVIGFFVPLLVGWNELTPCISKLLLINKTKLRIVCHISEPPYKGNITPRLIQQLICCALGHAAIQDLGSPTCNYDRIGAMVYVLCPSIVTSIPANKFLPKWNIGQFN